MKKYFGNLVYLLMMMPLGLLYFTILTIGFTLGAGMSITLIGLPILVSMIFVTYMLGDLERAITSVLLGVKIAKPEARPARDNSAGAILRAQVKNGAFWKELVYLLLKLPLGIISFVLTALLVLMPLTLIAAPLIVTFLPGTDFMVFDNVRVDTMKEALICLGAGLGIGFVSIFLVNALGAGFGKIAVWALAKNESLEPVQSYSPASNH